eukprot:scaffold8363_cov39-Cyclotella_meneghiniana.AAC.3
MTAMLHDSRNIKEAPKQSNRKLVASRDGKNSTIPVEFRPSFDGQGTNLGRKIMEGSQTR